MRNATIGAVACMCVVLLAACGGSGGSGSGPTPPAPPGPPGPPPTPPPDGSTPAAPMAVGHPNFLSPHASPIAQHGNDVFVVNTPADTLDVIDATSGTVERRIDVGIDPVGVAIRPDGTEVWVANHVSDSISVVDNDSLSPSFGQIIATIQDFDPTSKATRFDEPVSIAFASDSKAYVSLSSENQIAVIDVDDRTITRHLAIAAQDPRAMAVRDNRLYVLPFESNNQTQISGCTGALDGERCTFDATQHVLTTNNVLSAGIIVDVIRDNRIPDRDLFVFNTGNDQLVDVVEGVGTLLYGIAVDSSANVFVAQTDARNDANGRPGSDGDGLAEMENRAFLNQITRIACGSNCGAPEVIDLEPLPPANPLPGQALATPFALQVSANDSVLVATAASSDMLFTMDASTGAVLGRTTVGSVPRGIALTSNGSGQPQEAWVFNAVSNSVSRVDVTDPANPRETATVALEDPTHPLVKAGRMAFNDAGASTSETFSCESCHPDGGTDQLVWILDTPLCSSAGCTQIPPRVTMPIRGLRDTQPYHWDGIPGDPYGGRNTANINGNDAPNCDIARPETCTRHLVDGGLATTMCEVGACPNNNEGKAGTLNAAERDAMAMFLLSVPYPPAQRRAYDNVLTQRAQDGFRLFHIDGDLQGGPEPNVCGDCHRMPFWVSTNTPGTGMEAPTWRGAYDRWLILPQGRMNIIDFNFYRNITGQGIPEELMWRFTWASRTRFNPVWDMVVEGGTGFSGSFARQVTLNTDSASAAETSVLLDALEMSAGEGAIILQAEGVFIDGGNASAIALQYDAPFQGGTYVERSGDRDAFTRAELIGMAADGSFIGTFTARVGTRSDVDNPQPAIWTRGPFERQAGRQQFPIVSNGNRVISVGARHIQVDPHIIVNGRKVSGTVACSSGTLPNCTTEAVDITLDALPPNGLHFVQLQNRDGLVSNDFIFHRN